MYKVLTRMGNGKLYSLIYNSPFAIEYTVGERIIVATGGLFVFGDLESAKLYADSTEGLQREIWLVECENPRPCSHVLDLIKMWMSNGSILSEDSMSNLLNMLDKYWKKTIPEHFLTKSPKDTMICDSLILVEKI